MLIWKHLGHCTSLEGDYDLFWPLYQKVNRIWATSQRLRVRIRVQTSDSTPGLSDYFYPIVLSLGCCMFRGTVCILQYTSLKANIESHRKSIEIIKGHGHREKKNLKADVISIFKCWRAAIQKKKKRIYMLMAFRASEYAKRLTERSSLTCRISRI